MASSCSSRAAISSLLLLVELLAMSAQSSNTDVQNTFTQSEDKSVRPTDA